MRGGSNPQSVANADLEYDLENLNKAIDSYGINPDNWGVDMDALNEELKKLQEESEEKGEGSDKNKIVLFFNSAIDAELAEGLIEKTLLLHGISFNWG